MLLDVNMPGMDGFEVCRRVREHVSCPIIFLTARVEDMDQLDGFAAGADDYVLKPFSLEVLGRRVAAHMAREGRARDRQSDGAVRFFGEMTIDYAQRIVEVHGAGGNRDSSAGGDSNAVTVDLTKLEFDIIALLSKRPGQVFDRDVIYERVWGWDAAGDPSQVREHIRRIRNKFTSAGIADDPIATVWGRGLQVGGKVTGFGKGPRGRHAPHEDGRVVACEDGCRDNGGSVRRRDRRAARRAERRAARELERERLKRLPRKERLRAWWSLRPLGVIFTAYLVAYLVVATVLALSAIEVLAAWNNGYYELEVTLDNGLTEHGVIDSGPYIYDPTSQQLLPASELNLPGDGPYAVFIATGDWGTGSDYVPEGGAHHQHAVRDRRHGS